MIRLFLKCVTWISLIQVGHLLRERSLTIAIEDFNLATESLATFNKPQIHTTQVSRKWSSTVLKTRYTNTGIPWNGPNIKRKLYIGDIILIICFRKWQNFMWDWFIGTLNRNIIGQFFRLQIGSKWSKWNTCSSAPWKESIDRYWGLVTPVTLPELRSLRGTDQWWPQVQYTFTYISPI